VAALLTICEILSRIEVKITIFIYCTVIVDLSAGTPSNIYVISTSLQVHSGLLFCH